MRIGTSLVVTLALVWSVLVASAVATRQSPGPPRESSLTAAPRSARSASGSSPADPTPSNGPSGDYVGSAACRRCHDVEHGQWERSLHIQMTKPVALIFLFRMMKVDTVVSYDPWALYERNPDHYITARAVESACWMAGSRWDYPEHFKAGLTAQAPRDRYYYARGPQIVNRVVDIGSYIDRKVHSNLANVTQGPARNNGARLRQRLARQGRRLPLLGDDDETADRQYVQHVALQRDRLRGQAHGLEYAEYFHYVPPDESSNEEDYVSRHSVPL